MIHGIGVGANLTNKTQSIGVPTFSMLDSPQPPSAPTQTCFILSSNTREADEVSLEMFNGEMSKPSFQ